MDGDGTVAAVKEKLGALCEAAKDGDLLFIYWGSHGSVSTVGTDGYDRETFQTKAFDGWISGNEFIDILGEVRVPLRVWWGYYALCSTVSLREGGSLHFAAPQLCVAALFFLF